MTKHCSHIGEWTSSITQVLNHSVGFKNIRGIKKDEKENSKPFWKKKKKNQELDFWVGFH